MNLTPKQKQLLDYINSYRLQHGYAPAQTEIARHFGYRSLGTVQDYLVRLEKGGHLQKTWNGRRAIEVCEQGGRELRLLPLLGRVAAGRPIEALSRSNKIDVPPQLLRRSGEHFVLEVQGDSMIDEGILDGDYVIIRKQAEAHNGETVVALINGEATIKRYYHRGEHIELVAANPKYAPIQVTPDQTFSIAGTLTGVLRSYHVH